MNERMSDIDTIAHGLALVFVNEPYKIALWLLTENPLFGGTSPSQLIALRGDKGIEKVAKFVNDALDQNE